MEREEAIKIIRKNMPSDKSLPVYEALQTLVPELVESDDERIREEMIRYFTEMKKGGSASLPYDDCIAYLERQKEQKPAVTHGETYHVDTLGTQQVIAGKMPQKPAEWSEEDRRIIDRACVALRAYANGDLPEFLPSELIGYADRLQSLRPQPKQEWSEEDKDLLLSTKCIIDEVWHSENTFGYSKEELEEIWNWLNVAWTRLEYPKENDEWSEEDRKIYQTVFNHFNSYEKYSCSIGVKKEHILSWLKSLKPSWKPSEEQMEAFKDYIEDFQTKAEAAVGGWNNFDVMIELYEQLKKL